MFDEDRFRAVLTDALQLKRGDVVFVHSSIDRLGLGFPFYRILSLIREVIGENRTVLFPTYPRLTAHESLLSGEIFDVRTSPSFTGVLTEFARRQRGAVRSLNPTKSVCALGPHAHSLTEAHQDSPYPYDRCSPYYKLMDVGGKIIGLGVYGDLTIHGMPFFWAESGALFEVMVDLARQGTTMYERSVYETRLVAPRRDLTTAE